MTYEEAMTYEVTKAEAVREIERNYADPLEFFDEFGERDFYKGADVLTWLGY